jgi:hypothetical protein
MQLLTHDIDHPNVAAIFIPTLFSTLVTDRRKCYKGQYEIGTNVAKQI